MAEGPQSPVSENMGLAISYSHHAKFQVRTSFAHQECVGRVHRSCLISSTSLCERCENGDPANTPSVRGAHGGPHWLTCRADSEQHPSHRVVGRMN